MTLTMQEVLLIVGMFAVTFSVRYVPIVLVGRIQLSDRVQRALNYVPVAVLTAICAPAIFMPEGTLALSLENAALVGGAASVLIAWRTRNLLLTIVLGMVIYMGWRALMGA